MSKPKLIPKMRAEISVVIQGGKEFVADLELDGHHVETFTGRSAAAALTAAADYLRRKCRKCGCTFLDGCDMGGTICHWVKPNLCSACAPAGGRKIEAQEILDEYNDCMAGHAHIYNRRTGLKKS